MRAACVDTASGLDQFPSLTMQLEALGWLTTLYAFADAVEELRAAGGAQSCEWVQVKPASHNLRAEIRRCKCDCPRSLQHDIWSRDLQSTLLTATQPSTQRLLPSSMLPAPPLLV